MRAVVVVCLLAATGCDGVFGLNDVPLPNDGSNGGVGGLSFVQHVQAQAMLPALTTQMHFAQPPAAHDLIVVAVAAFRNTPTLVADTAGNMYSELSVEGATTGGSSVFLFYAADVKKVEQFTITVTSMEATGHVGQNELSIDAIEYHGAQPVSPLGQMQFNSGDGSPNAQVDQDCMPLQITGPAIMVAATTRDFNGSTTPAPGWTSRGTINLDHTSYAVLTTADRIAADEVARPAFSTTTPGDAYTWACVWATFR